MFYRQMCISGRKPESFYQNRNGINWMTADFIGYYYQWKLHPLCMRVKTSQFSKNHRDLKNTVLFLKICTNLHFTSKIRRQKENLKFEIVFVRVILGPKKLAKRIFLGLTWLSNKKSWMPFFAGMKLYDPKCRQCHQLLDKGPIQPIRDKV